MTVPVLTKKELGNTLGFDIAPGEGLMVLSDSTAAIGTASKDPTKRTRQFELNAHFVRDAVAFRTVGLKYVTTKCQYADALTKAADAAVMAGAKALMASTIPMPASFTPEVIYKLFTDTIKEVLDKIEGMTFVVRGRNNLLILQEQ